MFTTATAVFLLASAAASAGVAGSAPMGDGDVRSCVAERAHSLVGRKGNRRTAEQARRLSGAKDVRVIGWGNAYTADLHQDRLSIELNKRGRVMRVACF